MAYSVKWAVFRTRKIRVLRLIRLFSRPWRTCGKFWAIKSTKRLLCASEELWPKEDIMKMKHICKISSVGGMRRRILIVIRIILSFREIFLELELDHLARYSWNLALVGDLFGEIFLELGFGFIDGVLIWMPNEVFWFGISVGRSDIGLTIDVDWFDLPIREIRQLFLDEVF